MTIAEVRKQLELGDNDAHDAHLAMLISVARQQVERDTNLVCYTGSHTWKFTHFPCREWLELPDMRPVTAISSIVYTATDGTSTTWSSSEYTLETSGLHQFVRLNYGYSWPTVRGDINGITVTMLVGYASVAVVPPRLKQAVLLQVTRMFNDRAGIEPRKGLDAYDLLVNGLRTEGYS